MHRWLLTCLGSIRRPGPRIAVTATLSLLVAAALVATIAVFGSRREETRHRMPGEAELSIATEPPGAAVVVDSRSRGMTPTNVALVAGLHHVLVSHPFAVSQQRDIEIDPGATVQLAVRLWRLPPSVLPIRVPLPGARIDGFTFLRDGRLVMTVAIPPGDDLQLWLVDGTGAARRFAASSLHGAAALSPDGRLATLTSTLQANATIRYDGVQVASTPGASDHTVLRLHGQSQREELQGLAWSPDGRTLLATSIQRDAAGATGSRLLLRDVNSDDAASTRELLTMPATVVHNSASWSPAGRWVAFLARTQDVDTLVAVDTQSGQVRPLGDLGQAATPAAPFPPLDWSQDGRRLLFAAFDSALASHAGWLVSARRPTVLWVFDSATGTVQRLGTASGQSPSWHGSGPPLAFARLGAESAVVLRSIGSVGQAQDVARLPIATDGLLSALWDDAHGQVVLATTTASAANPGAVALWWVRFFSGDSDHV